MPPKRLTNLPANVFLDHIAPRLKTRNTARLNMATHGQVAGLANQARKLNAERKQAVISFVKSKQHALARRILLAMKGVRMFLHKFDPENPYWLWNADADGMNEDPWMKRYAKNYRVRPKRNVHAGGLVWHASKTVKFPGFGGLHVEVELSGAAHWKIRIYGQWINKEAFGWIYDSTLNVHQENGRLSLGRSVSELHTIHRSFRPTRSAASMRVIYSTN